MSNAGEAKRAKPREKDKKLHVMCRQCGQETNHKVVYELTRQQPEPDGYFWHTSWQIVECLGCNDISLRQETVTEDDIDEYGEGTPVEKLYPSRISGRKPIENQHLLPATLNRIYDETLSALADSLLVLAGVGLRAIIETICNDKEIPGANLISRINALVTRGIISQPQADVLHSLRILGNVAAHEVRPSKPKELIAGLEIAETMMKTIYILPELGSSIRNDRRRRLH